MQVGYIPYESCLSYEACSIESKEGLCKHGDYTCQPLNVCRTCDTYSANNGTCRGIETFPNVTVAEYGEVSGEEAMMAGACGAPTCPSLLGACVEWSDGGGADGCRDLRTWTHRMPYRRQPHRLM